MPFRGKLHAKPPLPNDILRTLRFTALDRFSPATQQTNIYQGMGNKYCPTYLNQRTPLKMYFLK